MTKTQTQKIKIAFITFLVILAAMYIIVYAVSQYYLSSDNLKEIVIKQISANIQRQVTASDKSSIVVGWDLKPRIVLKNFTVANANWSKQGSMLKASEINLVFSLIDLLKRVYSVEALKIVDLELLIEKQGDKKNWEFTPDDNKKEIELQADSITLINAKITLLEDTSHPNIINIDKLQSEVGISKDDIRLYVKEFRSGSSDLQGDISIQYEPLSIIGNIKSGKFSPKDFLSPTTGDGSYSIPHIEIPVNKLKEGKINLHFIVDKIAIDKLPIYNYNSTIKIEDQVVVFNLEKPAKIANGTLDVSIKYDLKPTNPTMSFNAQTSELDFATLLNSMFDKSPLSGSKFTFVSALNSNGTDLNTLISNLNGKILAQAGPGNFLNTLPDMSANIFSSVLSGIITFDKKASYTAFNCGVLNLKVANGIATANKGIGLEAATVKVLGSGTVDLRNGKVNFTIIPQNTSKSTLGVGDISLAQEVNITGTLADPKLSFNPLEVLLSKETARLATEVGGALAGGIAGAVAGSVISRTVASGSDKHTATASPCKTALDSN